ncbi:MAG: bifunctional serine/threonine-protein kinase/ABC transporter substrate-binding protein [Synechococcales bacterium]|nr:bifunctional serine/threonine-protein kinase/ABC transporter substrate-binding protein [Synechococcales bacterium]
MIVGQILGGRYHIEQRLGQGGFGHTYVASDRQRPGSPLCVLKHLSFTSQDPQLLQQARRMFAQEAETLERLGRHDQIPQLLAYFEQEDEFYLVQEFIAGRSLAQELAQPWRDAQVCHFLQDVLQILVFVHAQGVIHRDIKPDNLIRRATDDRWVLIDFGAVKTTDALHEPMPQTQSVPVYTTGYAASELCLGKPQFSSDLYALGVIGIQALTGAHPLQIPHDPHTCNLRWHEGTQGTVGCCPMMNADLIALLDRLTQFRFTERYGSAQEVLADLSAITGATDQAVEERVSSERSPSSSLPHPTFSRYPVSSNDVTQIPRSQFQTASQQADPTLGQLPTLGQAAVTVPSPLPPPAQAPIPTQAQPTDLSVPRSRWQRKLKLTKTLLVGSGLFLGGTAIGFGYLLRNGQVTHPQRDLTSSLNPAQPSLFGNIISQGEHRLSPNSSALIKSGTTHFAAGQFPQAQQLFAQSLASAPEDPEVRIYSSNAQIGQQKAYTIAAIAPLMKHPQTAQEILRGVAQAQWQINQAGGLGGVPLRVVVADDGNVPKQAQEVAERIVQNPDILGVIGHGNSDTTLVAAQIYEPARLVTIAPISSAVQLSGYSPYLFRTMPSDRFPAKALSEYMVHRLKKRKVAIFFNESSTYSRSLKMQFKDALFFSNQGQIVVEIDLSQPDFNPATSLTQVAQAGAEVILLASSGDVSDRALLLIQMNQMNQRRLPILAGDALYSERTLHGMGNAVEGMVLAVPAQQVGLAQSAFQQQAQKFWKQPVTWRSALAYDATQALAQAIAQAKTRAGVQAVLVDPSFRVAGTVQPIQFQPDGDPKGAIYLVQVKRDRPGLPLSFQTLSTPSQPPLAQQSSRSSSSTAPTSLAKP